MICFSRTNLSFINGYKNNILSKFRGSVHGAIICVLADYAFSLACKAYGKLPDFTELVVVMRNIYNKNFITFIDRFSTIIEGSLIKEDGLLKRRNKHVIE